MSEDKKINKTWRPKDFLIQPSDFGRVLDTPWKDLPKTASSLEYARLRAAKCQHRVIYGYRYSDRYREGRAKFLAEILGIYLTTAEKKMNGHSSISVVE